MRRMSPLVVYAQSLRHYRHFRQHASPRLLCLTRPFRASSFSRTRYAVETEMRVDMLVYTRAIRSFADA